jgi:uncharacterized protein (TIGR01319 family)
MTKAKRNAMLIDFGSTFTKVTAVDMEAGRLLGTARAATTVDEDITIGLEAALSELGKQVGRLEYEVKLACSSAAGGLRMVAIGLVPELTAQAASMAALGAGAKVLRTFSYEIGEEEITQILELRPEIILLAGGTDGGNQDTILANAATLSQMDYKLPVIVAGNAKAAPEACRILSAGGHAATVAENVLPSLGRINVEPVREIIREVFLRRIVRAKGLEKACRIVDQIIMPTPAAVLEGVRLISESLGEMMALDVGGATTDVYSLATGTPTVAGTIWKGLPEPYAKRTVEGDLGVRHGVAYLAEMVGTQKLAAATGLSEEAVRLGIAARINNIAFLPQDDLNEQKLDDGLARAAATIALQRHAGTVTAQYAPFGKLLIQKGKDLTAISKLLVTGGPVIGALDPVALIRGALADIDDPAVLTPHSATVIVDRHYILSAIGLLAQVDHVAALQLFENEVIVQVS